MSEPTNGTGERDEHAGTDGTDGTAGSSGAGGSSRYEPEHGDPTAPIWSDPTASIPEPPRAPHDAPPPAPPGPPSGSPYEAPSPYAAPSPNAQQPTASPGQQPNPYAYDQDAASGREEHQQGAPYPAYGQQPSYNQQPPYGQPQQAYGQQPYGQQPYGGQGPAKPWGLTSGKATAVLVLGIAALVLFCCLGAGVIPAIVALVLAPGAKREILASDGAVTGLSQIKAGRILSVIALVLTVLGAVLVGIGIASGAFNTSNSDFSGTF
jgi:hypothetical protein